MNELISLAKENAFVVIGLLLVTIYLQNRIHDDSSSFRQDMTAEFAAVRQDMSDLGERITRIETLVERIPLIESKLERIPRIESMLEQLLLEKQGQ